MAQTTNLQNVYKLDETSGTRADSQGSDDLTDNNTVGSTTGHVESKAAVFVSASSEYLIATGVNSPGSGDKVLVTFWCRFPGSLPDDRAYFMELDGIVEVVYRSSRFRIEWNGSATNVNADNFGAPSVDTWYFVECGYDGTDAFIAVNRGTRNTGSASDAAGTTGNLLVGRRDNASFPRYYDGYIEQLAIHIGATLPDSTDLDARYNSGAGLAFASWGGGGGGAANDYYYRLQQQAVCG